MKAGIYRTPNGNLVYVSKDRTIKATSLSPSSWVGEKVSHRTSDNTIVFLNYRCTHFADVPNGCTDPGKAIRDASDANKAEIDAVFGLSDDPGVLMQAESMQRAEMSESGRGRLCGRQSARKHRRRGDIVTRRADGRYEWRAAS